MDPAGEKPSHSGVLAPRPAGPELPLHLLRRVRPAGPVHAGSSLGARHRFSSVVRDTQPVGPRSPCATPSPCRTGFIGVGQGAGHTCDTAVWWGRACKRSGAGLGAMSRGARALRSMRTLLRSVGHRWSPGPGVLPAPMCTAAQVLHPDLPGRLHAHLHRASLRELVGTVRGVGLTPAVLPTAVVWSLPDYTCAPWPAGPAADPHGRPGCASDRRGAGTARGWTRGPGDPASQAQCMGVLLCLPVQRFSPCAASGKDAAPHAETAHAPPCSPLFPHRWRRPRLLRTPGELQPLPVHPESGDVSPTLCAAAHKCCRTNLHRLSPRRALRPGSRPRAARNGRAWEPAGTCK